LSACVAAVGRIGRGAIQIAFGIRALNDGFEIIVNAVTRTFRDQKEAAYQAARFLKSRQLTES